MNQERPYYYLNTDDSEGTNLQLFSFRMAYREFQALAARPDLEPTKVRERGAFIVMALGLSVVQLLGQNCEATGESVDGPSSLWRTFWQSRGKVSTDQDVDARFQNLIEYYDAIHHFGLTPNRSKHERVATLDMPMIRAIVNDTKKIWQAVIDEFCAETDEIEDCDIDAILIRNGAPYGVGD